MCSCSEAKILRCLAKTLALWTFSHFVTKSTHCNTFDWDFMCDIHTQQWIILKVGENYRRRWVFFTFSVNNWLVFVCILFRLDFIVISKCWRFLYLRLYLCYFDFILVRRYDNCSRNLLIFLSVVLILRRKNQSQEASLSEKVSSYLTKPFLEGAQ